MVYGGGLENRLSDELSWVRIPPPPPVGKRSCWLALCEELVANFRPKIEFFMRGIKIKNIKPILAIGIEGNGQISDFNKDVDRLYNYLFQRNFKDKIAGPLIGVFYTEFGGKYIVVIPIKKKIPVKRGIKILTLPKIKCISTMHKGSYKTIDEAFNRLREYLKSKCLKLKFPVREVYINSSGKEENYLTEIQIPLN